MVKIHWSVYIILGVSVLWISYRIDSKKFTLFIWLAYLFLIVGVAKLGIWFVGRKKESPVERKAVMGVNQNLMEQQSTWQQKAMQQRNLQQRGQQRQARYCPRCRVGLQGYENFCPKCGVRLR